jgi:hypothetical protein
MRKAVLAPGARWHIFLSAVFCLLAIPPFGYAQSVTELKSKAEDGDVQAQLALAKAYHLGKVLPELPAHLHCLVRQLWCTSVEPLRSSLELPCRPDTQLQD